MCGINVIVDKTCQLSSYNIEQMNLAITHRGPDYQQFQQSKQSEFQLFLGHTRLKIIDLHDRANQPMTDSLNRYFLIFNGEIYNYYNLRNQLIDKGCKFKTSSDTEVLLQWLIENGPEGITDLEGMFAFAFYDSQTQRLFCGRDPLGMKPCYYFESQQYLIISSELKGILASKLYQKQLNESQLHQYINYRHARFPNTFYKDVYELSPGQTLSWQPNQNIKLNAPEFFYPKETEPIDESQLVAQCEEKLIDSVGQHLIADVPVGLFLSGGIDSTLLLAILNKHYKNQYHTFSIGYNQNEKTFGTKDNYYAPLAAQQFGGNHEVISIGPEILDAYDDYIKTVDQPIGDSASLLTMLLSKQATKKVGVAWTGAGADELFAGYNRHYAFYRYLLNYHSSTKLGDPIKKLAQYLPTGLNHPFRAKFQHYKKFARGLDQNPAKTYSNFTSFNVCDDPPLWAEIPSKSNFVNYHLGEALKYDRKHYLSNDILALSDKMSMQSSLELRMPYLSTELVRWVLQIPPAMLVKKGRKWILGTILNTYGGHQFTKRRKEGLGLPFGNWLRTGHANHLFDFFKDKNCVIFEYIDKAYLEKQLQDHLQGKADNTLFLWSVIQLGNWLKVNFD